MTEQPRTPAQYAAWTASQEAAAMAADLLALRGRVVELLDMIDRGLVTAEDVRRFMATLTTPTQAPTQKGNP